MLRYKAFCKLCNFRRSLAIAYYDKGSFWAFSLMKSILLAFSFLLFAFKAYSQQQPRYNPDTIRTIVIDSVVNIRSHKLNAQDFIDVVLADTGFYKAFRDM